MEYAPVSTGATQQQIHPGYDVASAYGTPHDVTVSITNVAPTPPAQVEDFFVTLDDPAPSLTGQPMVVLFDGHQYPYSVVLDTIMSITGTPAAAVTVMPDGMLYTLGDLQEGMNSFRAAQQAALDMIERYEQQIAPANPQLGPYGALLYGPIQQAPMPITNGNAHYQQMATFQTPFYVGPQQLATPYSSRPSSSEGPTNLWRWMPNPGAKPTVAPGYPSPPSAAGDSTSQAPPPPPPAPQPLYHQPVAHLIMSPHPAPLTKATSQAARRERKVDRRQSAANNGPPGTFTFADPIVPGADVYVSAYSHTREYRIDERGRVQRRRRYQDQ